VALGSVHIASLVGLWDGLGSHLSVPRCMLVAGLSGSYARIRYPMLAPTDLRGLTRWIVREPVSVGCPLDVYSCLTGRTLQSSG